MAQNETWLKHDLLDAVKVQYLDGNLFSMDNAGNLIGVTLTRDGEDYSGGGSVSANVIRSDGGTVAVSGALSGKTATVVLPQAAYAVPGVVSIIVKLTASGQVTTIAALVANVYRSSTDTAIDPGTIIPSIQTLISQINTAVASIPADYSALWTKLAPAFSTDASYVAGQYVTYNSGLYRFNTSHSGSWSSSDVTAVNLGGEITDLKSAINIYSDYSIIQFIRGGKINTVGTTVDITSVTSDPNAQYAVVDCYEGDRFLITGTGMKNYRLWCFVDSNNAPISPQAGQNETANSKELTAPSNSSKLVMNITGEGGCLKGFKNPIDMLSFNGYPELLGYTALSSCRLPGWYGVRTSYVASITDLPTDYDGKGFTLEVIKRALSHTAIAYMQRITSTDGNVWSRFINDSGTVLYAWKKQTPDVFPDDLTKYFRFVDYIPSLGYTALSSAVQLGWYGCPASYVSSLTDLPSDYDGKGFNLEVFRKTLGSSAVVVMQRITSTDGNVWTRVINSDGSSVLYAWKRQTEKLFWTNKKVAWYGDSLSYGAGLSNSANAFPYKTAAALGMTIYNHAIGGSVIAKRNGNEQYGYDEIVFSLADFNSMTKDESKKYLVMDDPTNAHPFRIYSYIQGEWTPTSERTSQINGRSPIVDVITGVESDADVIVVALGFNDFMYHWTAFGEMSDRNKTTFYGALHSTVLYLLNNYPTKQIVFVKVLASRYQLNGNVSADWSCTTPDSVNPIGKTIGDYRNAVDEVCLYYSIPCLDLGGNIGFAQFMHPEEYYTSDNLHWNLAGHVRAASVITPMIKELRDYME